MNEASTTTKSELLPKNRTVSEFWWTVALTPVVLFIALFAVGGLTLSFYQDPCVLNHELGANNPLTLGAIVTGIIALAGLYYFIETDATNFFREDAGNSVQGLAAVTILLAGISNLCWEYLRVLALQNSETASETGICTASKQYGSHSTENELESLLSLVGPFATPNIIALTFVTCLVFGLCWAARDGLRLTYRGFRREIKATKSLLSKELQVSQFLQHPGMVEYFSDNSKPLRDGKGFSWRDTGLLVAFSLVGPLFVGVSSWYLSRFAHERSFTALDLKLVNQPEAFGISAFIASLLSWATLEAALYVRKRYTVSQGLLTSKSEANLLCSLFFFISFLYWLLNLSVGIIPFVLHTTILYLRAIRHSSQLKRIRGIWANMNNDQDNQNKSENVTEVADQTDGTNATATSEVSTEQTTNYELTLIKVPGREVVTAAYPISAQIAVNIMAEALHDDPPATNAPSKQEAAKSAHSSKEARRIRSIFRRKDIGTRIAIRRTIEMIEKALEDQKHRLETLESELAFQQAQNSQLQQPHR